MALIRQLLYNRNRTVLWVALPLRSHHRAQHALWGTVGQELGKQSPQTAGINMK